jgi:2-dehydro-3-deoxyphosphogluconate aldolase/(4S)-4-hydroxy-2-oxoglutarate aldolase
MSTKKDIVDKLLSEKILAIIRLKEQNGVAPVVESLVSGGIGILEITSNTPSFTEEIAKARIAHKEVLIGAGTVTSVSLAEKSIAAGAQFLVSPNVNRHLAEYAINQNIPLLMGAMTPTEISDAAYLGADIIKLFPAGPLGISYFKALKGPYESVPFYAVGGIGMENMQEWFQAGVSGVGVGGGLIKSDQYTLKEMELLTERTRCLLEKRP